MRHQPCTCVVSCRVPSENANTSTANPHVAEASALAPFIYFDLVPNFGFNGGIANLTLEAVRFTMETPGKVSGGRVAVAHLRTSLEGLRQLKAAIEGIESIMQRPAVRPRSQTPPAPPHQTEHN
jgi:hypothetical protein